MKKAKSVVIGVTGSIAAYKACDVAGSLRKGGLDVHVVMTENAREFVSELTFRTVSRNRVTTGMFDSPDGWNPQHTSLADMADLILIAPATASIIAKLASGVCDDILTCTVYASKAPVLIAPAMNEKMYRHPVTQANIEKLRKIGYSFVGPVRGELACGHLDIGHIAPATEIVAAVKRLLK